MLTTGRSGARYRLFARNHDVGGDQEAVQDLEEGAEGFHRIFLVMRLFQHDP